MKCGPLWRVKGRGDEWHVYSTLKNASVGQQLPSFIHPPRSLKCQRMLPKQSRDEKTSKVPPPARQLLSVRSIRSRSRFRSSLLSIAHLSVHCRCHEWMVVYEGRDDADAVAQRDAQGGGLQEEVDVVHEAVGLLHLLKAANRVFAETGKNSVKGAREQNEKNKVGLRNIERNQGLYGPAGALNQCNIRGSQMGHIGIAFHPFRISAVAPSPHHTNARQHCACPCPI